MIRKLTHNIAAMMVLAALGMGLFQVPAQAESDFDDVSQVSILPGWQRDDGFYMAAVQVDLEPGWKTYWRSPGDTGIAPTIGSAGLDKAARSGCSHGSQVTHGLRDL